MHTNNYIYNYIRANRALIHITYTNWQSTT